jgi:hypothetical protein
MFKIGQVWADNSGASHTIIGVKSGNRNFPVTTECADDGFEYIFTDNGKFYCTGEDSYWDLVKLVKDV